ncbi:MAG TPA: sulfotransferase [Candidatus Hydrogenedentes bacterium]|nr:sulfotransferase [Candidatus Hydrogenedentota bacterium]
MPVKMLFVIGAPRSGTTMLERMLASHSMIMGGPEPHLLTPLAHLGVWAKVDKAPYDHILAAESQKLFVESLPNKEQDYWTACRAYCDVLYGQYLKTSGKPICMDKTPAYALILPFMAKVFPDAKYVVITRHPIATFSSYANSFFDGDYHAAQQYNPILNRYVPALANFLRQKETPYVHVKYEDLVKNPETWMERIYDYIGVPFERETIEYGKNASEDQRTKGLGDPIGVRQHTRPSTASVKKWVEDLASDTSRLNLMIEILEQIPQEDLETIGYPLGTLLKPLEEVDGTKIVRKVPKLTRYRLERKAIIRLRAMAKKHGLLHKMLKRVQLACDVLLRE